jgi:uncharacterized membrane protein YqhA
MKKEGSSAFLLIAIIKTGSIDLSPYKLFGLNYYCILSCTRRGTITGATKPPTKYLFMKNIYSTVRIIITVLAFLMLLSGIVLTVLGGYEFVLVFSYLTNGVEHAARMMAIDLLHAVDLFLVAIVFFVLSLGILVLFNNPDSPLPIRLPEWLRIKNFMQLKIILWEAILTTLVVAYLAMLAEKEIQGEEISVQTLVVPGGIFLIALSLFFLKKGEGDAGKNGH